MKEKMSTDKRKHRINTLFETYPVLKDIDDNNGGIIGEKVQFKTLDADEQILSSKGACQGILFVLSGLINIKRINENGEETNLYNISRGELCHEALSCLLRYKPLNIIGCAVQNSDICIVPVEVVNKILLQSSEFLSYMYKDIYEKFTVVIKKKEDKNHKSIEERLVESLIDKKSSIIYSTHKDIAFEIDSSREVVSRKLKSLEKDGYVKLERGKIIIIKDLKEIFRS